MILNIFTLFISQAKTRYISCTQYQFCDFRKNLARFSKPLTVQDKSKLTENEKKTYSRCTTQSSGKGVNG